MADKGAAGTPVRTAEMAWFPARIPLPRPLQRAALREMAVDYLLLKITADNGPIGVAEGSAKVPWTGGACAALRRSWRKCSSRRCAASICSMKRRRLALVAARSWS